MQFQYTVTRMNIGRGVSLQNDIKLKTNQIQIALYLLSFSFMSTLVFRPLEPIYVTGDAEREH